MIANLPTGNKERWSQSETVELQYVFDFDLHETVVYTGPSPFPPRVFVLHFWRKAKDGIMHLLGYRHQGHWRDPTVCYPDSYVRYYRPAHTGGPGGSDKPSHKEPEDTTQFHKRSPAIEQMAYREPLLQLDHDVWELPTLKGKPAHLINTARKFSKPANNITRQHTPSRPALNKPIERAIEFVIMSTHFEHQTQAELELAKLIKVLKQFPQLQVTIQGNYQPPKWERFLTQLPKTDSYLRTSQDRPFYKPFQTKWPTGVESYSSIGQLMDSRARTMQRYIIDHGINARRVHTARGQYTEKRTFTIIFSN